VIFMKVMLLEKPGPVETRPLKLAELPCPEPGLGEVRVKITYCGVCRTDLHIVEGELCPPRLPLVPGHQAVGVVERIGPPKHSTKSTNESASHVSEGDRVGVPWLYETCGECEFCTSGRENLCDGMRFTGYSVNGGYAAYMVAPEDSLVRIPESFSDQEAAPLLCAGIIGWRSIKVAGLNPGETLGLFGFGASAHLAIQVAKHWGCRVLVFTRKREHQELAKSLGATWVGQPGEEPPCLSDRVITFAPAGYIIPLALKSLKKGGTLAINAVHMDRVPEMDYSLLYWEKKIVSVANSTHKDAEEFMEIAARTPLRVSTMLFPLEEANEALIRLKHGMVQGEAVLNI